METSAKESANVEEAFTLMTREIKSRVVLTERKAPVATGDKLKKNSAGKKLDKKTGSNCC